MKYHPILFNGEMVRAILDGKKTQTRRVVRDMPAWVKSVNVDGRIAFLQGANGMNFRTCPYGQPEDRLWVRETFQMKIPDGGPGFYWWHEIPNNFVWCSGDVERIYRSEHTGAQTIVPNWIPSIYMPRWASRITLEVLAVRVERLQDITPGEAIDEGIENVKLAWADMGSTFGLGPQKFVSAFSHFWDSINAQRGYSWDSNPWVWVVEFQPV